MQIDKEFVITYWAKMLRRYKASVKVKQTARNMQFMGWFLERRKVMTRERFMEFSTTVGDKIYIPYKLGVGSHSVLTHQLGQCAHELVHVAQYRKQRAMYYFRYLTSDSYRTQYEMAAYAAHLVFHRIITGGLLGPAELAGHLKHYGCSADDMWRATRYYAAINRDLQRGVVTGHHVIRDCARELKRML